MESICFVGDVACPRGVADQLLKWQIPDFKFMVVNLEGAFSPDDTEQAKLPNGLYNSREALPIFANWNVRLATMANNHALDVNLLPSKTKKVLADNGIEFCGAGDNLADASKPVEIEFENLSIVFLAFGWHVISCRIATSSQPGVNPLDRDHILKSITDAKLEFPNSKIVPIVHWDYELEIYPLPAQRTLGREMIEAGADIVVGHHPHCAHGIEYFEGRPVIYSLGNWFLPHGNWFGFQLDFPQFTNLQLALEWSPKDDRIMCHWYSFNPETHTLTRLEVSDAKTCRRIAELTPFAGMENGTYRSWFRKNRRQNKALPIYLDHESGLRNKLFDHWVGLRHQAVRVRSWIRNRNSK